MNNKDFDRLMEAQLKRCIDVLLDKAGQYAEDGDRLHNFRVAAALENRSVPDALGGMMAKHTTSIYDMVRDPNWDEFPLDLWEEKITDHLNYLFLLNAAVREVYETVQPKEE